MEVLKADERLIASTTDHRSGEIENLYRLYQE
jgi:hypothetical protein